MGASNVAKCYTRWQHLPDRAFRALVYMALVTLDAHETPRYFGGRDALITHGLGRPIVPEPAPFDLSPRAEEFRRMRRADYQAAKVVISQLMKAGCIRRSVLAAKGRSAEYELLLDAATGYVSPTDRGTSDVPTGYADPTDRGTSEDPPRRSEEQGGTRGGTTSPEPGTAPEAVGDYAEASKFLQGLPEGGQPYMLATADLVTGMRERVLVAAEMARRDVAAGLKLRGA